MSVLTASFWRATLERSISTAAQAALLVIGADQVNVLDADWQMVAGFAAGGAVLTVLKSLAASQSGDDSSPSFGSVEKLR